MSFHFSDKKCVTFNPQTLDFDTTNQCMLGIKFSFSDRNLQVSGFCHTGTKPS